MADPKKPEPRIASCQCGQVTLALTGKPIVTAVCYCDSCRTAGEQFARQPGSPAVVDADGGTPLVLFRKDRVRCLSGADLLQEHRLKPESPTRRFTASCCQSPLFLEYTKGHWLSVFRSSLKPNERPAIDMRVVTKERPEGVTLPGDVPDYATHSGKFIVRLMAAWAAMGFRSPPLEKVMGAGR
ncbi:GFA family protein [Sphingopyxis sp.]|uniref:GFA family protein n=1 Tax=Sphingopyxis sp. TaxID=1908224 RepID=UPI003D0D3BFF